METGGFKGRSRELNREDLYAQILERFGIEQNAIVSEYGMTELTSQYYSSAQSGRYCCASLAAHARGRSGTYHTSSR